MRYEPHTYEGCKSRASQIISRLYLRDLIPEQSLEQWEKYIKATDPIEGKPQTNMEWSLVNNRNGYQHDIPGLISEIIAQCNLARLYGKDSILIAQDKHTQHELKIDFFVRDRLAFESSVQVKTFRFNGDRMSMTRDYYSGQAKSLALVDIDEKLCYFIDREIVKQLYDTKRGYFFKWDLDELATHKFNNKDDY